MIKYVDVISNEYPIVTFLETKVFVPENIVSFTKDDELYYKYDETEYTNTEYLALLTEKHQETELELSSVLLACAELYESLGE